MWFFLRKFLYRIIAGEKYLSPLSPNGDLRLLLERDFQQLLAENKKLREDLNAKHSPTPPPAN